MRMRVFNQKRSVFRGEHQNGSALAPKARMLWQTAKPSMPGHDVEYD